MMRPPRASSSRLRVSVLLHGRLVPVDKNSANQPSVTKVLSVKELSQRASDQLVTMRACPYGQCVFEGVANMNMRGKWAIYGHSLVPHCAVYQSKVRRSPCRGADKRSVATPS